MRARTFATLLIISLVPALGIGHCELGDARAFGQSCLLRTDEDPIRAKVVSFLNRASGLFGSSELRLEVTACGTSLLRIVNGAAEEFGPIRLVEPGDAKALHDALVNAGALDAESAHVGFGACGIAISAPWIYNEVTVYEPSPLPGTAWSNAFSFGTCASTPQTAAIEQILSDWIEAHFDL